MAKAYFIRGGMYSRYDTAADRVDASYPKAIASGWSGIDKTPFANGWDSAVDWGDGRLFLFRGSEYLRVDHAANGIHGGVRPISDGWPALAAVGFGDTIQAAINWGTGVAYFFRGDLYVGYDIAADTADPALPIRDNWPGMAEAGFGDTIDSAVMWDNGNAYFFKGDQYVRYEIGKGVAEGYPLPIADYWPGFAAAGLAGGVDAAYLKLPLGATTRPADNSPIVGRLVPGDHLWYWNGKVSTASDIPRRDWFPDADPKDAYDFQNNGRDIYNFVVHADGLLKRGQPHMQGFPGTYAWLNNNPGNITGLVNGSNWGQYPNKFNWHHFLVFPSADLGRDAIKKVLWTGGYPAKTRGARQWPAGKYRDLGITEAFHRWAPADDGNNPDHYGAKAAAAAGVSESTIVGALSETQMNALQNAVTEMEGWVPGTEMHRDDPAVPAAVRAALA
ncbi:hemopexin repeat-containing protein [Nocardia takedensis]